MSQALTKNALEPFRQALSTAQKHFAQAIPTTVAKYMTPERLTKITLSALSRQPLLLQCSPQSVLRCVMDAAAMGLEPSGGVLGHAYMVPFKNKSGKYDAQLIVGYRGYIDLARRSTQLRSVEAHVVYSNDHFEIEFGRDPKLVHRPTFTGDRGNIVAVYCVAELADGARHVEVMTAAEVEAIRRRSRASDKGPWVTDYSEMARKTVVRRAAKYWPLSTELVRALELESNAEGGIDEGAPIDMPFEVFDGGQVESEEPAPKTKQIAAKLKAKQQQGEGDPEEAIPVEEDPALAQQRAGIQVAETVEELDQVWAMLTDQQREALKEEFKARMGEIGGGDAQA